MFLSGSERSTLAAKLWIKVYTAWARQGAYEGTCKIHADMAVRNFLKEFE